MLGSYASIIILSGENAKNIKGLCSLGKCETKIYIYNMLFIVI